MNPLWVFSEAPGAAQRGQRVPYVTERCVFQLGAKGGPELGSLLFIDFEGLSRYGSVGFLKAKLEGRPN